MEPNTVGDSNGAASPLGEVNSIGHKYPKPPKWYRLYVDADELKIEPYREEDGRTESPGGFMSNSESADSSTAVEEDLSDMEGNTSEKRHHDVTTRKHGSTELSQEDVARMNRKNIFSAEQVAAMGGADCAIAKYRIENSTSGNKRN
ncbi:hypothetical protein HII31_13375 [Pseudocercospora fuligena]|uniref:Uncharacterized protein n=1 Tax=Pseudocercospora fuligena TaxID=685502 RepID=A0A8H6R4I0_9PEZI|nr:hypothetical protein HII31_13375 [Pseudocercospora fuligena]